MVSLSISFCNDINTIIFQQVFPILFLFFSGYLLILSNLCDKIFEKDMQSHFPHAAKCY